MRETAIAARNLIVLLLGWRFRPGYFTFRFASSLARIAA